MQITDAVSIIQVKVHTSGWPESWLPKPEMRGLLHKTEQLVWLKYFEIVGIM